MTSFFFGPKGQKRLIALAGCVRDHYKQRLSQRYSREFDYYTPWMGLDQSQESGALLPYLKYRYEGPSIITDSEHLNHVDELKIFKNRNQTILDPLDDWSLKTNSPTGDEVSEQFSLGLNLIRENSQYFDKLVPKLVDVIIPLGQPLNYERGFSCQFAKGAIFLSPRADSYPAFNIAVSIAHETGHQALMLFQTVDSIIVDGQKEIPVYSAVRKTERPAMQTYHAIAAALFMVKACDVLLSSNIEEEVQKMLRRKRMDCAKGILDSDTDLRTKCELTPLGTQMLSELVGVI